MVMNAPRVGMSIAVLLMGLGISSLAFAQTEGKGGYVGFGIGEGQVDLSVSDFNDGSITSGSVDDSDTGWKLFGGYGFNKNLAVEGGYADLGKANFSGASNGLGFLYFPGPVDVDIETTSFFVDIVGIIPFKKWALFGKIGFHNWDAEVTVTNPPVVGGTADDDGTDPHYGLGFEFRPSERWGVRLEWEVFTEVLEEDIEALSVSGMYRFGTK
jgi:OOP family OmpA-OmpF porin